MSPERKRAYIYLLYDGLLGIRAAAWDAYPMRPWRPPWWRRAAQSLRDIAQIADALHNLPVFVAEDFRGFDEDYFWRDFVASAVQRNPNSRLRYFRDEFERREREGTSPGASS